MSIQVETPPVWLVGMPLISLPRSTPYLLVTTRGKDPIYPLKYPPGIEDIYRRTTGDETFTVEECRRDTQFSMAAPARTEKILDLDDPAGIGLALRLTQNAPMMCSSGDVQSPWMDIAVRWATQGLWDEDKCLLREALKWKIDYDAPI